MHHSDLDSVHKISTHNGIEKNPCVLERPMDEPFCQNFAIFEDMGASKIRTGPKDLVNLSTALKEEISAP